MSAMGRLATWWLQADHYDEFSSHLQARGLTTFTRAAVSGVGVSLALVALATIPSTTGPRGVVQVSFALAAAGGATIGALLWAVRWPTRAQSKWYVVFCNASIGLAALAQNDPNAAILGCTTFATLAGYVALMHSAPLVAYNFAVTWGIVAFETVRIAHVFNIFSALCGYAVVLLVNLAVPFGIQTVGHVLGADAVLAERDQLTGLLNRRAFSRRVRSHFERGHEPLGHLVITVIDLDRFKQLNDRYGHSTGDAALIAVARALHDTTDDTAVICRSGGEEFVIADVWHPAEVGLRAQQLCDAIAALPFGITASIGTAGIHPAQRAGSSDDLLAELIGAADGAMYAAKRRGGNQTGHHHWPPPMRIDSTNAGESDYQSDGLTA
jgi:diguanylate cyclase (GGDEF)-like protein